MQLNFWLNRIRSICQSRSRRPAKRRQSRASSGWVQLETLEDRSLQTVAVVATFANGVLRVEGTAGRDTINVQQTNQQISVKNISILVNGQARSSISASDVTRIEVNGGGGNDTISLRPDSGQQAILISTILNGGAGNDTINGGDGSDSIQGSDGADSLLGNGGNDSLMGGVGNDTLNGGNNDDNLQGGVGNDSLIGGAGRDQADFSQATAGVTVNLTTGAATGEGTDRLTTIEDIFATNFADILTGNTSDNRLDGRNGNDKILGDAGNDLLMGGNGNDTLNGGIGSDSLFGGEGADSLIGGLGNDSLDGGLADDFLLGEATASNPLNRLDTQLGGGGRDTIFGAVNHVPVLAVINNTTASQGASVAVPFSVSDADGDQVFTTATAFNADGTPWGGTIAIIDSNLSLTPSAGFSGRVTVRLAASDGKATTSQSFTVHWQAIGISLNGREIVIQGTEVDDVATIRKIGGQFEVEFQTIGVFTTWSFDIRSVDQVRAILLGGNDSIENQTDLPMYADGGSGSDHLTGGFRSDTLIGGADEDHLMAGTGVTVMLGGDGNDSLEFPFLATTGTGTVDGGAGEDFLFIQDQLVTLTDTQLTASERVYQLSGVDVAFIFGATGNCNLNASEFTGSTYLYGQTGNDTLRGGSGNDYLGGGSGNDQLFGGAGDDTLDGELGSDTLVGESGNEVLYFATGTSVVDGGDGFDRLIRVVGSRVFLQNHRMTVNGANTSLAGIEVAVIDGTEGSDILSAYGYSGSVTFTALGGDDEVYFGDGGGKVGGGSGNDTITGGSADEEIQGDEGNDLLRGMGGYNVITGGYGDDLIYVASDLGGGSAYGDFGDDTIIGSDRDDYIQGDDGNDDLRGMGGEDFITGGDGDDTIQGGGGNDVMRGLGGTNFITGDDGNDEIFVGSSGGGGSAYGGLGNDTITGGDADDDIQGGEGSDLLRGMGGSNFISGDGGNDEIYTGSGGGYGVGLGGDGDDTIIGGDGDDGLFGQRGNDTLKGRGGNDRMYGYDGNDSLYGMDGDDYLDGGVGTDVTSGGAGTDTYRRSLTIAGLNLSGEEPFTPVDNDPAIPPEVAGAYLNDFRDSNTRDNQWDINQDSSSTCSFLAALAAYSERTGNNNDLIQAIKYDAASDQYGIQIYYSGRWTTQWVNADWTEGRDPGGKIWVTLYQKAYLQAWNVNCRDAGGRMLPEEQWQSPNGSGWKNAGNALDALTPGFSTRTLIENADAATIRNQIYNANTFGMVASSKSSGTTNGVISSHGYMMYDAFVENGEWKIRLYNPWGHDSLGGALDGNDEGLITLNWDQFKANFTGYYRNA